MHLNGKTLVMNLASEYLVTAGWVLVSLYAAVILFFVIRGAKGIRNLDDYATGSILFSPAAVGLSLAASITSAATFIINPGFVALYGISGVLSMAIALPVAAVISLVVLTKGFRKHGSTVKARTMAQWIQTRYKSSSYGFFFALLSMLLITFIVLICVGLTKVLSSTLNISEFYALLGVVLFVFGYMMFGGANSMVYTNAIQAMIMILVAFILLSSGYDHFRNGVYSFMDTLRSIDPLLTETTNQSSFLFRDYFEIFVTQAIVGIAIICQPHILTKSLLLNDDKDVNTYLWVGGTVQMLFFLVVITGLYIRIAFPDLQVNGEAIPMDGLVSAYVVSEFPVFIGLIVVMGLLSAGLSTLEGLIQSLSSTITGDILKPIATRSAKLEWFQNNQITINRMVIILLAIASMALSWDQIVDPKLSVGIFAQNGVYAYFSAAFIPILFGMFYPKADLRSVYAASVVAVVVHFTMYYGQLGVPFTRATGENPGVAAAVAIILSVLTALVLSIFQKKDSPVSDSALETEATG